MTKIYCFEVVEGQEWILPTNSEDHHRFNGMDGTVIKDWDPPSMSVLKYRDDGQPRSCSDFPWLGAHVPVFSRRAVDALATVALEYGQLLPLKGEEDAWLYNVTHVLDALDEERSRIVYFDDGDILTVEQYAFQAEKVDAAEVFKLPLRASPVFVTEQFVQRVRSSGLVGVSFEFLCATIPAS